MVFFSYLKRSFVGHMLYVLALTLASTGMFGLVAVVFNLWVFFVSE